ncbi:MAG: MFS transporter [Gammaproteobacteria bacterium]|jgi:sugar phosphate permease
MQKSGNGFKSWIMWLLAAGFFLVTYFARVAPSVMVNDLMRHFQVSAFSIGTLSAFLYYAYIGMQLPVGALFDFCKTRLLLTLATFLCGISCILFACTNSIIAAEIFRFLLGVGSAFAFVGALKVAGMWFSPSRFGVLASSTQALGMLGAALGIGPVSFMVMTIGWRQTIWLIGGALLLLALLIGIILRDRKTTKVTTEKTMSEIETSILHDFKILLKNPQLWLNALIIGCMYAPTGAFAELWGPSYLRHVNHWHIAIAANAVSTIFIGWTVGGPIIGWISDSFQRRKVIIVFTLISSLLLMSAILYLPNLSITVMFILLFCYGFCNAGTATAYAIAKEISPAKTSATAIAFTNMFSILIGSTLQPIIGLFLDLSRNKIILHGIHYYSAHDYKLAMLTLPGCLIAGLIAVIFLKESYGQHLNGIQH